MRPFQGLMFIFLGMFISGCGGVSQKEYDALKKENEQIAVLKAENEQMKLLKQENEKLVKELEELKSSPDRLLAASKMSIENEDFDAAKSSLSILVEKHPESVYTKEAKNLLETVNNKISKKEEQKVKAEKDKMAEEKKKISKVLNKLRDKTDFNTGITRYYDKGTPRNDNQSSFHAYLLQEKGKTSLRCKISYAGDKPLQIKSYEVKTDKGSYTLVAKSGEIQSYKIKAGSLEQYETEVDATLYSIIREVADSKTASIRFNGMEKLVDKPISESEKQGIKNILEGYTALGGELKF